MYRTSFVAETTFLYFLSCILISEGNGREDIIVNDIDLLTLQKYFLIYAKATKLPYIDRKYQIYLIASRGKALEFIGNKDGLYINDRKYYHMKELHTICKKYNVKKIIVIDGSGTHKVSLDYSLAETQYYNAETKAALMLVKEKKDISYLADLRFGKFLVPIHIENRIEKQTPKLTYACAVRPAENSKMCLAFTDISEFNKWNEQMDNKWKLIQVNLRNLNRIRKGLPVLIDPLGNKIVLTSNMFRGIKENIVL